MKKSLTLSIVIFFTIISLGQNTSDSRLRLVAGYPNRDFVPEEWDEVYNSAILRIQGDSLAEDVVLCDSLHFMYFLRYYYDYNLLTALIAEKENKFKSYASLRCKIVTVNTLNLDSTVNILPQEIDTYGEKYKLYDLDDLYAINNNGLIVYSIKYTNYELPKGGEKSLALYCLYSTSEHQLTISSSSIYRNVVVNGSNSGPQLSRNVDILALQGDTINNLLRIPSPLEIDSIYPIILPDNFRVPIYGGRVIINNPHVIVMYFFEFNDKTITYRIFDKEKQEWSILTMPTVERGKLLMNNYGQWLVGCNRVKNENGIGKIPLDESRMPGINLWKKERTKYSPSILYLTESYERFNAQGYLYLYNYKTKAYIEWNTGQADSEILLVKNDVVFYRKYDEIHKVKIIKGKELGQDEVILKNKNVPSIHWAFLKED